MIPCCYQSDLLTCPSAFASAVGLEGPHRPDPVPDRSCETTIGMVVFQTHKGEQAEAILDFEGRWRCPRLPVLDRVLNALYEPSRDTGSDMPYGYAELIRVAAWLKGEVRLRAVARATARRTTSPEASSHPAACRRTAGHGNE